MTTSPRPDRGRPDNHRAPYLGYVPVDDVHEAAAWHLEDCVNDYALGAWAQASGRADDAAYLDQRAASYTNLFSPSVGFFRGKKANGAWRTSDADFSPITWGYEFTEGAPWHYIAPAPFDAQGMARLYGNSPEALADKIDALFEAPKGYAVGSYGKAIHEMVEAQQGPFGQYAHPNEPVHHLVWLYNAVGKPERAQARLRQILDPNNGLYTLGVDNGGGYLGDEDNGQMSAWYVFASAGLYPASPGIPEYSIGSPVFDRVILTLDSGRTFEVIAENNSPEHVYVQYAELNGLPYDKAFLSHADVTAGGTLRLHMGDRPSTWAHAPRLWPTSQTTFPQRPQPLVDRTAEAHVEASPSATPTAALIDDDSSTVWSAQEAQATLWFELPLSAEGPLRQYTLTSAGDRSGCDPTMWRLEGSEDGSTWRTLDSRDDELFPYRYQLRSFALTQPATARHLRLVMQASMAGNCLKLAEVELLFAQDP
jgi:putative alpha-1,2-mannosidase